MRGRYVPYRPIRVLPAHLDVGHVEWMHESLGKEEVRFWKQEIERNGGGITRGQIVYHAWKQMAWDRHLAKLTPRTVTERDTRF